MNALFLAETSFDYRRKPTLFYPVARVDSEEQDSSLRPAILLGARSKAPHLVQEDK